MLRFLIGRAGAGKTAAVIAGIKANMEHGIRDNILLVPEQYSHEAERELCRVCGDRLSLYAEVLSFSGLARRTAAKLGGAWKTLPDDQRKTAKQERLLHAVYEILRHIYTGNAPYPPGTPEHAVFTALAQCADRIVQRFHIEAVQKLIPPGSSLCEMAQDFLYNNRTGDDDAISIWLKDN